MKKITLWISEKDQGQSDALNKGFKHCTGEIYGWLNSDDIYLPNAFKIAKSTLEQNVDKKIVLAIGYINNKDNIIDYNHAFDFNLNHFKYEGFHLNAQSMFWRKSVRSFSGFIINLYNCMDYQMILEFGINEGEQSFIEYQKPLEHFVGIKIRRYYTKCIKEQKFISEKYKYQDKYRLVGKVKNLFSIKTCDLVL